MSRVNLRSRRFIDGNYATMTGRVGSALLRAFVALCEIHWRGGVVARYGRGPTPNPVEALGPVRGTDPSTRRREGKLGVASPLAIFAPAPKAI